MSDDLDPPAKLRFDPMLATAGVALVDPQLLEARELLVGTVQQQRHGGAILNIGGVHPGSENQTTGIDQDMPLAAVDALGAILAADTADAGGANRLAVDDTRTGLRLAPDHGPELLPQDRVQECPGATAGSSGRRSARVGTRAGAAARRSRSE
jgi:hypothetical protein